MPDLPPLPVIDLSSLPIFVTRSEVPKLFPFIKKTLLEYWAHNRMGPAYTYIGRDVVYETAELVKHIRESMKAPGSGRPMTPAKKKALAEGKKRRGAPTRAERRARKRTEPEQKKGGGTTSTGE